MVGGSLRWSGGFAFVLALASALAAWAPADALRVPDNEPRGSLLIEGDAAFTAENGVRSGSGSEDDPFVIEGWTILPTAAYGVKLVGTRAHVVIRDIDMPLAEAGAAFALRDCPDPACPGSVGVWLRDVENARLEGIRVLGAALGIWFDGSSRVAVRDAEIVRLEQVTDGNLEFSTIGLTAQDGEQLVMRGLLVEGVDFPVVLDNVADAVVSGGRFRGDDSRAFVSGVVSNLAFVRNRFFDAGIEVNAASSTGLAIVENEFHGGIRGVVIGRLPGAQPAADAVVCANEFLAIDGTLAALHVRDGQGVAVHGNSFRGNDRGLDVQDSSGVVVERNLVTGSLAEGAIVAGDVLLRENVFEGNALGVHLLSAVDARDNWWGDASGPSGAGPGAGETLTAAEGALFDPWLGAEPDLSVLCPFGTAPTPPQQRPSE